MIIQVNPVTWNYFLSNIVIISTESEFIIPKIRSQLIPRLCCFDWVGRSVIERQKTLIHVLGPSRLFKKPKLTLDIFWLEIRFLTDITMKWQLVVTLFFLCPVIGNILKAKKNYCATFKGSAIYKTLNLDEVCTPHVKVIGQQFCLTDPSNLDDYLELTCKVSFIYYIR